MIQCANCSTINSEYQYSCHQCGAKLWKTCGQCQEVIPYSAKFCGRCRAPQNGSRTEKAQKVMLPNLRVETTGEFRGRTIELEKLPPIFASALNGEGQALIITGPAGIGKSCLIAQALNYGRKNGMDALHLRPHHQSRFVTFFPLLQMIRILCGWDDDAPRETIIQSLRQLTAFGLSAEETALVMRLFGGPEIPFDLATRTRDQFKTMVFSLIIKIIHRKSLQKPLAIAFDDTHNQDPQTMEFINVLLDLIRGMRVVVIVGCRDREPELTTSTFIQKIALGSMEAKQLIALVQTDFGTGKLPLEAAQELYLSSKGNPVAIRHIGRYLREADILVAANDQFIRNPQKTVSALPGNLEAAIKARLDLLTNEQKELVMLIVLLGDDACVDRLNALTRHKAALNANLNELKSRRWIVTTTDITSVAIPDTATRDILDSMIPQAIRAQVQPAIARILQEKGSRVSWQQDFLVAYHLGFTGSKGLEGHYALERISGNMKDIKQFGLSQAALSRVSLALREHIKEQGPDSLEKKLLEQKLTAVLKDLGEVSIDMDQPEKALKYFELGLQLARGVSFHYLALDLVKLQIHVLRTARRFMEAHKMVDVALKIAQGIKFKPGVCRFYYAKGQLYEAEGRLELALGMYMEALRLTEEFDADINPKDNPGHKAALGVAVILLRQREALDKVGKFLEMAMALAARDHHDETLQQALEAMGRLYFLNNRLEEAITHTEKALATARRRLDGPAMARYYYTLGFYHAAREDRDRAEIYFTDANALAIQSQWRHGVDLTRNALKRIRAKAAWSSLMRAPELTRF